MKKQSRSFETLVHQIIQLAIGRDSQEKPSTMQSLNEAVERHLDPTPAETALLDALKNIGWDDLRKLEVLMYAGRDRDDMRELHRSLHVDTPEVTADMVFSKGPLARYLRAGLEECQRRGIDVEAPLPRR